MDVGLEYAPDADQTANILTDCSAFIPTTEGYIGAPSAVNVGMPTLASDCRGSAVALLLDQTTRLFAGTQTKIYERDGFSWADVTRTSSDYVGGAESLWRFAQYGNATIAVNRADETQFSLLSGEFDNLTGAPKASIVFTVGDFVMLMDYDDGTEYPDGWHCSGIGDYTEWDDTDVATQSASGRLLDVQGRITAGARLGSQAVAYKENGIWLGTFQGAPIVWSWELVPGGAGCVSQEALVEVTVNGGNAHLFLGKDDIYIFDGSRPMSIATGKVRQYLQENMAHQYRYKAKGVHDRVNAVVRWYFVSKGSGGSTPDMCLAYNYRTGKWGRDDRAIQTGLEYISASISWDDLGTLYSTWDDLPTDISYNSPFWSASQQNAAVFDDNGDLVSLTGVAGTSTFTTGYYGDQNVYSTAQRVRLRFNGSTSATGSLQNFWIHELGQTDTAGSTYTLNGSKFDFLRSARWHKLKVTLNGDYKLTGMNFTFEADGTE